MSIDIDRPVYRLQPCCMSCKFFRRKSADVMQYQGFCIIGEVQYSDSLKLPKEKRKMYWIKTVLDAICDNHMYKSRARVQRANRLSGAIPQ